MAFAIGMMPHLGTHTCQTTDALRCAVTMVPLRGKTRNFRRATLALFAARYFPNIGTVNAGLNDGNHLPASRENAED